MTQVKGARILGHEVGTAGLADELQIPIDQARYYVRELKSEGLDEATQACPNAKNQKYRLHQT